MLFRSADDKTAGSKTVGKKISFVQFLTKHANKPVKESTARKARAALIEFGLNPDVPLRVYLSFYAQTFSWHMTDAQAVKYAEALESGNKAKVAELQKISRANTLVTVALLRKTYITMMDDASVPAILISKKVETTKAPPSSTSPSVDLRKSKETTPDDDPFA